MRVMAVALAALVAVGAGAGAQAPGPEVPPLLTGSLVGGDLYAAYCATCHGPGGRGDGPVAAALRVAPTDLTMLARANGGAFPRAEIVARLDGTADTADLAAHGSSEMPIWGALFRELNDPDDVARVRVASLVGYLESIQAR
jgi:mono/diheme cytochrome c family protein